ncbi:MAG: helix-turn-helix domain-containing protein [Fimbriimonadaceae bacterium]|nr:helix-turn-helix domain-containing protein [Fimbriimonadaceae bacterium]
MRTTLRCDAHCPVKGFTALFSGKWSLLVLHALIDAPEPIRFGEVRKHVGDVTQKELTKTLREFELLGLVTRTVYAEVPPRVEYAATPFARTLSPVLDSVIEWADAHRAELVRIAALRDELAAAGCCPPESGEIGPT